MPDTPPSLISYVRMMVGFWRNDPRDDAELLVRYAETRDETAFATLVWRHGIIAWRVCRHILGDTPDAEDAFQSAFMALSHKGSRIPIKRLAGWLHHVARQAALDIRAKNQRRKNFEQKLQTEAKPAVEFDADRTKLFEGLDEELANLPENLRVPLLLHFIEGKSQAEVARVIGCAKRAVQKRLAKGEAILRERMERRGLALGAISVAALLGNTGGAPAIPGRLIESTARAAMAFRAGTLTGAPTEAAEKLLRSLTTKGAIQKFWWVVLFGGIGSLGFGGTGLVAWKLMCGDGSAVVTPATPKSAVPETRVIAPTQSTTIQNSQPRVDAYGDPLPPGAIARIGTTRLRQQNVKHIVFLADGKSFVAAGKTIRVWDLATGRELRRLEGYSPNSVEFDGFSRKTNIISFHKLNEQVNRLWDAATGQEMPSGTPKPADMRAMGGSNSDGKRLLIHKKEGLALRDQVAGKEVQLERSEMYNTICCAFSPDGKTLVTGSEVCPIRCWDTLTGHEITPAADWKEMIDTVAFSRNGHMVATCDRGGRICLWDAATGRIVRKLNDPGKTSRREKFSVTPLVFTGDGRKLISDFTCITQEDKLEQTLRISDVTGNGVVQEFHLIPGSLVLQCVLSPDDKSLALFNNMAAGWRIVDLNSGKETRLEACSPVVAFAPNGRNIAVKEHGSLSILDLATKKNIRGTVFRPFQSHTSLSYSPDGRYLATTEVPSGMVSFWEAATLEQIWESTPKGKNSQMETGSDSAVFSPNGWVLATVGGEPGHHQVHLWDVTSGQEIGCLNGREDRVTGTAFIGNSHRLASWSTEEGTVLIRDLTGQIPVQRKHEPPPSAEQMRTLWNDDLCGSDAARAYQAIFRLMDAPEQAVQLLREHLRPGPQANADHIKRLLKELDSNAFAVRQRARDELNALGESSVGELRRALEGSLSVEVRDQVEKLVRRVEGGGVALGQLRALAVLEHIDSPDSRLALKALAEGDARSPLTQEAKATLERLSHKEH